MVVNAIGWIVLGVIAGLASGKLARRGGGLWLDVLLGIISAVSGGWILTAIAATDVTGFNVWSHVAAVVGATAVLTALHLFMGMAGLAGLFLMAWDGFRGSASQAEGDRNNEDRI